MEPRKFGAARTNAYNGRWNWWYSAIADWMIAHPGGKLSDCAAELGKHPNTISLIVNTDMFRDFLQRRKDEWRANHDFSLSHKLHDVAEKSMDILIDKMEKQGDKLPTNLVAEIATSALDRLGYGPKQAPGVAVSVAQDNRVQIAVDATALAEAREAMRLAEEKRAARVRLIEDQMDIAEVADDTPTVSGQ